jgi:hypothetical protein
VQRSPTKGFQRYTRAQQKRILATLDLPRAADRPRIVKEVTESAQMATCGEPLPFAPAIRKELDIICSAAAKLLTRLERLNWYSYQRLNSAVGNLVDEFRVPSTIRYATYHTAVLCEAARREANKYRKIRAIKLGGREITDPKVVKTIQKYRAGEFLQWSGRPPKQRATLFIAELARIYRVHTGHRAARNTDWNDGKPRGPFYEFVRAAIEPTGLEHCGPDKLIRKVVASMALNRRCHSLKGP